MAQRSQPVSHPGGGDGPFRAARGGTGWLFLNPLNSRMSQKAGDKGKMAHGAQVTCQYYITSLAAPISLNPCPLQSGPLYVKLLWSHCSGDLILMPRVMPPQRGWDRLQWVTGVILSPPLGRKMQVYHNEEATGGTEPPMGLLETGQAAQGQALCAQEPRPQELSGNTRGGLEAQERRRFSASELMTRLHSSLRLGRSTAPRALTSGSGAGVIREGTSYPLGSEGGQGRAQPTNPC